MKTDIAIRWVEALRSGDYKQTTDVLKTDTGFCCLGVLCELAVEDGIIPPAFQDEHGEWQYGEASGVPPFVVQYWSDLDAEDAFWAEPESTDSPVVEPFYQLNDTYHMNFDDIADVIEREIIGEGQGSTPTEPTARQEIIHAER